MMVFALTVLDQQLSYIAHLDAAAIREACPESLEDDQDVFLSVICDRSPLQRAKLGERWEADNGCTLAVQVGVLSSVFRGTFRQFATAHVCFVICACDLICRSRKIGMTACTSR
jgi:hypothetical protein